MIRLATMPFAALLLCSCAMTPQVPSTARSELAPTGKLRVGINVQNFLLVNKERAGGEYSGIAVDLAGSSASGSAFLSSSLPSRLPESWPMR